MAETNSVGIMAETDRDKEVTSVKFIATSLSDYDYDYESLYASQTNPDKVVADNKPSSARVVADDETAENSDEDEYEMAREDIEEEPVTESDEVQELKQRLVQMEKRMVKTENRIQTTTEQHRQQIVEQSAVIEKLKTQLTLMEQTLRDSVARRETDERHREQLTVTVAELCSNVQGKYEHLERRVTGITDEFAQREMGKHVFEDRLVKEVNEKTETIQKTHKQQLDRLSNRITKCEEEHADVKEYVNQKVAETIDTLKENQDIFKKEMFGQLQEIMRNQNVNKDQLEKYVTYQAEAEIRENNTSVADRVRDLRESITETMKQELTMIRFTLTNLKKEILEGIDEKIKGLHRLFVDGHLLEMLKLDKTYTDYLSNIDGRLKSIETKQDTADSQLAGLPEHLPVQLEQLLKQLENNQIQRHAELSNEGTSKVNELRAEVNNQLMNLNQHLVSANFKLQMIETLQNRFPIGFTARATGCRLTTRNPIVTGFSEVTCNEGGYYNPKTGLFTAPVAGIYVVNLTHTQSDEGEIFLNVVQTHRASQLKTLIAYTWTYGKHSTSTDNAVVRMQEGDSLHVKVQHYSGSGQIWSPSSFSCFSLR